MAKQSHRPCFLLQCRRENQVEKQKNPKMKRQVAIAFGAMLVPVVAAPALAQIQITIPGFRNDFPWYTNVPQAQTSASDPKSTTVSASPSERVEDGDGKLFTQSDKQKAI